MKLTRMVVVLAGALAVSLTVVILRAETTRLHFELAQLDRKAEVLLEQLRESELELARNRNPAAIQERIVKMRVAGSNGREAWAARKQGP